MCSSKNRGIRKEIDEHLTNLRVNGDNASLEPFLRANGLSTRTAFCFTRRRPSEICRILV